MHSTLGRNFTCIAQQLYKLTLLKILWVNIIHAQQTNQTFQTKSIPRGALENNKILITILSTLSIYLPGRATTLTHMQHTDDTSTFSLSCITHHNHAESFFQPMRDKTYINFIDKIKFSPSRGEYCGVTPTYFLKNCH